ncbi:uncharacterized protein Dere_GG26492 [Drosophila erecta]|uniref:Uncharacterized protein n=1 Tax=Drosophila erecta TaxID=7220 RepID=A0A0Q5U5D2_DROER|nr:uncharacterized protein Dere_GG26492 [Drosophila erecta]
MKFKLEQGYLESCENVYNDLQRFTPRIRRFDKTIDSINRILM